MPVTKLVQAQSSALRDQINISVKQAISQVLGPQFTLRILSTNLDLADLLPIGQNLSIKMSIDIYPKDEPPTK